MKTVSRSMTVYSDAVRCEHALTRSFPDETIKKSTEESIESFFPAATAFDVAKIQPTQLIRGKRCLLHWEQFKGTRVYTQNTSEHFVLLLVWKIVYGTWLI